MPRILTVDDSRLIRTIVMKQAQELGCDVTEAENGEQALARLVEQPADLIVLDVTMPVLDGPGMMAQLRGRGDQTPVLMLTSDSTRQAVVGLMKHGIVDYILKPFRPEELTAKIRKALRLDDAPAPSPLANVDILLVASKENVERRLRAALPPSVTLEAARDPQQALSLCRKGRYGVVVIDGSMPDDGATALMKQIRVLQPKARFVSLHLRSAVRALEETRANGFDGALYKPFREEEVEELVGNHLANGFLITRERDVIRAAPCRGTAKRHDRYFAQVALEFGAMLEAAATECYDVLVFDASAMPANPDKVPRLFRDLRVRADKLGLTFAVVGTEALARTLAQVADTADMRVFDSIDAAKGPAAS